MSLLSKIRSALGLDEPRSDRETRVTVERERAGGEPPRPPSSPSSASTDESGGAGKSVASARTAAAEAPPDEPAPTDDAGEPVDSISGIGPAYAERLGDAGVRTVADLAAADAERLAAETDIAEKRIRDWMDLAAGAE